MRSSIWASFLLAVLAVIASAPNAFAQQQTAQAPRLTAEEVLTKTVAFISVPYKQAGQDKAVTGTCFFVFVPDERLGKDQGFIYTVTNRHIAAAPEADPGTIRKILLEVNLSHSSDGYAAKRATLPLNNTTHWYFPDDDTVDLAVLPVGPKSSEVDFTPIPLSLFATRETIKSDQISTGDQVLFIGFFFQFPGNKRMEPIIRHGVIAMMPVDRIAMSEGDDPRSKKLEHLYLADVHAFHGNSGSPLFVQIGGYRNGGLRVGGFPYLLMGVVNGYIPEANTLQASGAATFESSNNPNSGISTFVPAQELVDLLESPALQRQRDRAVASMHAR
jgi:Trypsin-like peptidase domain